MKKSELKKIIQPMVKECLQESVEELLLESGLLEKVISEVLSGVTNTLLENKQQPQVIYVQAPPVAGGTPVNPQISFETTGQTSNQIHLNENNHGSTAQPTIEELRARIKAEMEDDEEPMVQDHLKQSRERLENILASKGVDTGQVKIFENIKPIAKEKAVGDPLKGTDENDPGIPLSFFGKKKFSQIP